MRILSLEDRYLRWIILIHIDLRKALILELLKLHLKTKASKTHQLFTWNGKIICLIGRLYLRYQNMKTPWKINLLTMLCKLKLNLMFRGSLKYDFPNADPYTKPFAKLISLSTTTSVWDACLMRVWPTPHLRSIRGKDNARRVMHWVIMDRAEISDVQWTHPFSL